VNAHRTHRFVQQTVTVRKNWGKAKTRFTFRNGNLAYSQEILRFLNTSIVSMRHQ